MTSYVEYLSRCSVQYLAHLKYWAVILLLNFKTSEYIFWMLLLFSCQVMSSSSRPHGLQHARPPCPSPSPRVCPSLCTLNWWYHPTTSSSVTLFFCLQSFPASGSFPVSRLFASAGQSTGASASDKSPLSKIVLCKYFSLWFLFYVMFFKKNFYIWLIPTYSFFLLWVLLCCSKKSHKKFLQCFHPENILGLDFYILVYDLF